MRARGHRRTPRSTRNPSLSTGTGTTPAPASSKAARASVAGILDPDPVARISQQQSQSVKRLLCAIEHDDLLGVAANAAKLRQIMGDRLAQIWQAARISKVQACASQFARRPRLQPLPDGPGKLAGVGDAGIERSRNRRLAARCYSCDGMATTRGCRPTSLGLNRRRGCIQLRHCPRHKRACPTPRRKNPSSVSWE
jgi:hypothetical protein